MIGDPGRHAISLRRSGRDPTAAPEEISMDPGTQPVNGRPTGDSPAGPDRAGPADVAHRRTLFGVDDATLATLAAVAPHVREDVDDVVDEFYRRQLAIPSVAEKLAGPGVLERLRPAQHRYVLELFAGRCDTRYIEDRLHIGLVHERLSIDPQHYLAALRLLRELVLDRLLPRLHDEPARMAEVTLALDRLVAFDSSLVMDTYIENLVDEVGRANEALHRANDDLERKVAERTRQLEEQVRRDSLTGLFNSGALRDHLRRALSHARRRGRPLTLVYFDVDEFKQINDTRGHTVGDEVLSTIGEILRGTCRTEDVPCRYGGDEFCIVVVDAGLDQGEALGRRVCERFAEAYPQWTLSLGLAQTGPDDYCDADVLIDRADRKMYEAKREPGFQIRR
jgi:diguanylate cyclase (GGDEF)-like protein